MPVVTRSATAYSNFREENHIENIRIFMDLIKFMPNKYDIPNDIITANQILRLSQIRCACMLDRQYTRPHSTVNLYAEVNSILEKIPHEKEYIHVRMLANNALTNIGNKHIRRFPSLDINDIENESMHSDQLKLIWIMELFGFIQSVNLTDGIKHVISSQNCLWLSPLFSRNYMHTKKKYKEILGLIDTKSKTFGVEILINCNVYKNQSKYSRSPYFVIYSDFVEVFCDIMHRIQYSFDSVVQK